MSPENYPALLLANMEVILYMKHMFYFCQVYVDTSGHSNGSCCPSYPTIARSTRIVTGGHMIQDEECTGSSCLPFDCHKTQKYGWTVEGTNRPFVTIKEREMIHLIMKTIKNQ